MPDKKKADTQADPQNTHPNITPILPKNPRKIRALAALARGDVMRNDLDNIVGATNSPQVISELRGTGWIINCERVPMIDRDGRHTMPGMYSLAYSQRQRAISEGVV